MPISSGISDPGPSPAKVVSDLYLVSDAEDDGNIPRVAKRLHGRVTNSDVADPGGMFAALLPRGEICQHALVQTAYLPHLPLHEISLSPRRPLHILLRPLHKRDHVI